MRDCKESRPTVFVSQQNVVSTSVVLVNKIYNILYGVQNESTFSFILPWFVVRLVDLFILSEKMIDLKPRTHMMD